MKVKSIHFALGVALGSTAECLALILAGWGHGTYVAFFAFFSIFALLPGLGFFLLPLLYGFYAVCIGEIRNRRHSGILLLLAIQAHYAGAAAAYVIMEGNATNRIQRATTSMPEWCVITLLYFVFLNALVIIVGFTRSATPD